MKERTRHSTALWVVALACMLFGFAPLLVMAVTAGMEFMWLFATEPQSLAINAFEQVFHDWSAFYLADGHYNVALFTAQVVCACLWCGYLFKMRKAIC
jgi:hypothetical protein